MNTNESLVKKSEMTLREEEIYRIYDFGEWLLVTTINMWQYYWRAYRNIPHDTFEKPYRGHEGGSLIITTENGLNSYEATKPV